MKFLMKKDGSEAMLSFSDKDIQILKNNNNNFIIRKEDLPHFKNGLANIVANLADIVKSEVSSRGHETISPKDISKK